MGPSWGSLGVRMCILEGICETLATATSSCSFSSLFLPGNESAPLPTPHPAIGCPPHKVHPAEHGLQTTRQK